MRFTNLIGNHDDTDFACHWTMFMMGLLTNPNFDQKLRYTDLLRRLGRNAALCMVHKTPHQEYWKSVKVGQMKNVI